MCMRMSADRLKLIRLFRDLTQKDLAGVLNADASKISDIERAVQSPTFEDVGVRSRALHFSMDALYAAGKFDLDACLLPTWPGREEMLVALKTPGKEPDASARP